MNTTNTKREGFSWREYNPEKHAALIRAKSQYRVVWFTMLYLMVTTVFFMVLLVSVAFGWAKLPDALVEKLAWATVGQFAGAPLLLYRALFSNRRDRT